jgi:hypothetical protein
MGRVRRPAEVIIPPNVLIVFDDARFGPLLRADAALALPVS